MNSSLVKSGLVAALLCGTLVSGGASANQEQEFSALGGIEAKMLSAQEMDAIHGALTASQIMTAYTAAALKIAARSPRLANTASLFVARAKAFLDSLVARGLLKP